MRFKDDVVLKVYPVIKAEEGDFGNERFISDVSLTEHGNMFTLDADLTLESGFLKGLYEEGKLRLSCIVDSPHTKYREVFDVPPSEDEKWSKDIPAASVNGPVEVTFVLTANEELPVFDPKLKETYGTDSVTFPKYAMVGHTEVHTFKIDKLIQVNEDVSSIVSVVKDMTGEIASFNENDNRIQLYLPVREYLEYEKLKGAYKRSKQAYYITQILADVIGKIKNEIELNGGEDPDAGLAQFTWYTSLRECYKSCGYNGFTDKKFMDECSMVLIQKVLGPVMYDAMKELGPAEEED